MLGSKPQVVSPRRIQSVGLVVIAAWVLFFAMNMVSGRPVLAVLNAACIAITALVIYWCGSKVERTRAAMHAILAFSFCAVVALAMLTGQSYALGLWFLPIVPVVAGLVMGVRVALYWGVACAVTIIAIAISTRAFPIPSLVENGFAEFVVVPLAAIAVATGVTVAGMRAVERDYRVIGRALKKLKADTARGVESGMMLRGILDRLPAAMVVTDAEGHATLVNDRFCDLFEVSEPAMDGGAMSQLIRTLLHRKLVDPVTLEARVPELLDENRSVVDVELKDGRTLELKCVRFDAGSGLHGYLWEFNDVSFRVLKERALEDAVNRDELTGLASRRYLSMKMREMCANNESFGLAFADLDGFKSINDQHGHDAGDAFLRATGKRLIESTRAGDTVARLGGDEFAILMPGVSGDKMPTRTINEILGSIREPYDWRESSLHASASIGMAFFPDHGDSPEALLKCADQSMYDAKRAGKDRAQYASAG